VDRAFFGARLSAPRVGAELGRLKQVRAFAAVRHPARMAAGNARFFRPIRDKQAVDEHL